SAPAGPDRQPRPRLAAGRGARRAHPPPLLRGQAGDLREARLLEQLRAVLARQQAVQRRPRRQRRSLPRALLMADQPGALCGVLGYPVGHSRSPAIQAAAFRSAGLDWRYVKLPVRPELFEETVRALPASGYRGANVTIPHRLAALGVADRASPAAAAIGAANSLSFVDGRIEADNTDAGGLLDALDRPVAGLRALVLGAGGAGRAAAWALREAGAAGVAVWNRTRERADALARDIDVVAVERPGPADVLVNATSVGL